MHINNVRQVFLGSLILEGTGDVSLSFPEDTVLQQILWFSGF